MRYSTSVHIPRLRIVVGLFVFLLLLSFSSYLSNSNRIINPFAIVLGAINAHNIKSDIHSKLILVRIVVANINSKKEPISKGALINIELFKRFITSTPQ